MQLGTWMADLKHAMRTLWRTPGFTVTAVGMLGLAIGALGGMFSVVNTVLLDRLPYADPDRLVDISASAPGSGLPADLGVAPEFFLQYKEQSRLLQDVAEYDNYTATMRAGDRVERVRMSQPTNSLYSTLGVVPLLGRLPNEQDEDGVVVISHALWTAWFGQDPSVIGRSYDIADKKRTIVGVMGRDFRFPRNDTMLWISSTMRAADIKTPGQFGANLVGRMAPGASMPAVADELSALAARLPERFGGTPAYARLMAQHRAVVTSLEDRLLGNYSGPLWVLFAATCLVLLIACANVVNLFLVRIEGRHQEMAVRRAIGAARGRLMRLHMAEAVVVAALAAVAAVVLAALLLPIFLRVAPPLIPRLDRAGFGIAALLFTAFAAAVSAFICGGLPALRGSSPDLTRLREGGRGSTRQHHWLRHGLVAGQTALALALLIGSGLLMRSAYELRKVDPGYDTRDVLTFQIAPERPELNDALTFARFNLAFLDRLAALPGVQTVGLVENVPLNEDTSTMRVRTEQMSADSEGLLIHRNYTAGDYFKAMGIDVLAGRTFSADDHGVARGNVIVSKSAAALLWPGRDPIGQRLQRPGQTAWEMVVGVVNDVMQDDLRTPAEAAVYFPMADTTADGGRVVSSPAYVVKTARAETIAPEVRALVHEVAPEAPMYRVYTMAYLIEDSMTQLSFTLLTLGIASLLALILGAVGLYAVLSYVVDERTREIGVRMALGARAAQVRAMVVGQGVRVVAIGVVTGVLVALAGTRVLSSLLFGVNPNDVATFIAMPLVMLLIGLIASYLPARRASNLDPMVSLRRD
jgi:predicted permease